MQFKFKELIPIGSVWFPFTVYSLHLSLNSYTLDLDTEGGEILNSIVFIQQNCTERKRKETTLV